MKLIALLLFLGLLVHSDGLKFLCYSPRTATSHVNFLGKLSDSLIDAGHDVVILSSIFDSRLKSAGSDRARIIEIPADEIGLEFERRMPSDLLDTWNSEETWRALPSWQDKYDHWVANCNRIFHLAGINKFAVTESVAYKDGMFDLTQVPNAPSYVPSIMGGSFGDEMTIAERAFNLFNMIMFSRHNHKPAVKYQNMFERNFPGFPDVVDLMAANSLFFLNSDPLVDFPRPSAARMIDIGGIAVSNGYEKLNEEWSSILDLRPKTVFMSFGTFAKAFVMPEEYKETIRATARALPDVTFIWKYEKPDHNVTHGIPNLLEATWVPQNDLLRDPRLSAFVTHCGQGSTTEANYAGVPLVVVPVIFDQVRNAFAVRKARLGLNLHKSDLGRPGVLERAIREVLENPEYTRRAQTTAAMLNDKPFTAREVFVRNMEFLAKHGPLRQLDHYGRHLSFAQYYLIDVIGAVAIGVAMMAVVVGYVTLKLCGCLIEFCRGKRKEE